MEGARTNWVERVSALRQWTSGEERAPHKPLLLLYALGRHQSEPERALRYTEVERDVAHLLREYGPPRSTSPGYPFHHLVNDGVWEVRTDAGRGSPGPGVRLLRESGARGRLAPQLRTALDEDPALLPTLARTLLELHFPPSLHEDIAADAGLDLEAADGARVAVRRLVRDPRRAARLREQVLEAYGGRCAFCGFDGALGRRPVGLEAAHVRWWAYQGPDHLTNALCLCSLHHKLFDKGVLGIDPGLRITVSARFTGSGTAARTQVTELAGRPVAAAGGGECRVAGTYAAWHAAQVFRP
ncbi:restriction endonuclease [Streptomyces albus subsp. chlorinus]|uniref:phosphorothioated DNA-binding restriction endonuclease n=1 Tax=Streptomyces albus TaxID=1888 RepID=UPI001570BBAE|nr:HNH endonuclease [Streptomyces albus]NSC23584.1 restriction endonuclease [Streptomyces albus subsp. chlorinus]